MKFLLNGEGVWNVVNTTTDDSPSATISVTSRTQGTRSRATRSPNPPSEADAQRSHKAAYLIYQSCTPLPQSYIAHEDNPSTMWFILRDLYSRIGDDDDAGQELFEEFWLEQFKKYGSMEEYGAKLKTYQDQLACVSDKKITDSNLILQLIRGLPPHYDDVVMMIRSNKAKLTFRQALKMLIERERILGDRRQSKALISSSFDATNHTRYDRGSSYRGKGSFRGNNRFRAHGRKPNWQNRGNQQPRCQGNDVHCWYCTHKGYMQSECRIQQRAEEMQRGRKRPFAASAHATFANANDIPVSCEKDIDNLISDASATPMTPPVCLAASASLADRIDFHAS